MLALMLEAFHCQVEVEMNRAQQDGSKMDTLGGPPPPVIVTIRDNRDYIGVLLYCYSITITRWGVLLMDTVLHKPEESALEGWALS